ncbi:MAG: hypothetical protein QOI31_541 [Solirubrobacterales bacterium]|jgi:hypothetical protein|nr:hypothetical protein [Solirubrobacterales bacterium]
MTDPEGQEEEFRVEVELDDDDHHLSLADRLRATDLDDEARERLGSQVVVTRDGPHLFLYATTQKSCEEAERVVRELIAEDELTGSVRSTRWHPVEQDWKDITDPLPQTPEELEAEEHARDERMATEDPGIKNPRFVTLGSYKPKFLRDLGL